MEPTLCTLMGIPACSPFPHAIYMWIKTPQTSAPTWFQLVAIRLSSEQSIIQLTLSTHREKSQGIVTLHPENRTVYDMAAASVRTIFEPSRLSDVYCVGPDTWTAMATQANSNVMNNMIVNDPEPQTLVQRLRTLPNPQKIRVVRRSPRLRQIRAAA